MSQSSQQVDSTLIVDVDLDNADTLDYGDVASVARGFPVDDAEDGVAASVAVGGAEDEEDAIQFPADDDDRGEEEQVIPWRDVPLKIWLKVRSMNIVHTSHGPSMVVLLERRDGTLHRAWTTKIIEENLILRNASRGDKDVFIKSLGLRVAKRSHREYFHFVLRVQ